MTFTPRLSIVTPTFNNEAVLRRSIEGWRRFGGPHVEVIVIEDGCRDGTAAYLKALTSTPWGARHVRWAHEDDAHELKCTNRGFTMARGELVAAWQDDMFLRVPWFVPEILATFDTYPEIGLLSLSRGLQCLPLDEPIVRWDDLHDPRRLQSTIGDGLGNWARLQEVDIVIRPWIVRRACLEKAGMLDEAFRPTEWDEADLAFRIREAGWRVATHGYERVGAYFHLGSTTTGALSDAYKARVLRNGLLFHDRWRTTIARDRSRPRRTWRRRATAAGWIGTGAGMVRRALQRRREGRT